MSDPVSKYDPLYWHLDDATGAVTLTFAEVADLVGGLPPSAYEHPSWWSRNTSRHVQARAWVDAGYHADADLAARTVRFHRQP